MRAFKPRSYQQLGTEFLLNTPRAALFAQPGLGKTVIAETVIDALRIIEGLGLTLVVVPKRVLDTEGWQRELKKWSHLTDLAIQPIEGDAATRRTQLCSQAPIHLINYELLPWLLDELAGAWPYDMVILDESTRVKGHDSTWFKGNPRSLEELGLGTTLAFSDGRKHVIDLGSPRKIKVPGSTRVLANAVKSRVKEFSQHAWPVRRLIAPPSPVKVEFQPTAGLKHIAQQTRRWINLTGTPMPGGVKDLWSQTYLLDDGKRLGNNITRFRETYQYPNPYVKNVFLDQPDALPRVIGQVQDICLSIIAKDYLDLPELIPTPVDVTMPPELMKRYRTLEDQFFVSLEGKTIEAANSAVLSGKLMQFTSGAMYTDKDKNWEELHSHRIDALRELSDEVGGPMLVAYHYAFNIQRIKKALPDAVQFDGTLGMIDAFARGEIRHLLLHPQSAGHGVEGLQDGTDTIAFFDLTWSAEFHDQVIERIGPTRQLQSGHPRPVFAYYLMTPDSVDTMAYERVVEKKSKQDTLMRAMQRRKK